MNENFSHLRNMHLKILLFPTSKICNVYFKVTKSQLDQIIISLFLPKFTNFDYKSLCINVRLNRDSSNFLFVGSNLCCFKQWRAGKLPIKFFPEEKCKKVKKGMQTIGSFLYYTYHLYALFFTANNVLRWIC